MARVTRDQIIEEAVRCGKDPLYFINRYAKIQHPMKGLIPFDTYDYQDDVVKAYLTNRFNIVLKARQLGLTTITAAYVAWLILLHRDKNVLIVATKQDTAKNMIRTIRNIFKYLPKWLREVAPLVVDNRHSIELDNGSRVKAVATSSDVGRSEAVSLLVVDEVAHIEKFGEIWVGLWPTISTGGQAALLSTPNGTGNFFHECFVQAKNGENNFNCKLGEYINPENPDEVYNDRLMWWVHPDHDQAWFDKETRGRSPRDIAQEYLCFGKDTKIFTDKGYKSIQDLVIGNKVLTHKGRFKKIVATNNRISDDVYRFKTFLNRNATVVTGEHPLLSELSGWKESKSFKEKDLVCVAPKDIPEWRSQIEYFDLLNDVIPDHFEIKLKEGQEQKVYLNDRRHKVLHNRSVPCGYDLGYFTGIIAAEGHFSKNSINLAFNYPDELDSWVANVLAIVEGRFGLTNSKIYTNGKSGNLVVNSAIVTKLMRKLVKGDFAHEKHLSDYAYEVSNKYFLQGFIDGVFDGDGCVKDVYDKVINLTSERLIYDIKYSLTALGLGRHSVRKGVRAKVGEIMGRQVNMKSQSVLKLLKTRGVVVNKVSDLIEKDYINEDTSHKNSHRENENFVLSSIVSKEILSEPVRVYNIEVEDDHSFVTEHFVSHNCNFNASGQTFLHGEDLMRIARNVKEPKEVFHADRNVWIWERPSSEGVYLIPCDVSRGDAQDYSAFHVLRVDTHPIRQVAEYKGKIRPDQLGILLMQVSSFYNNATIAPENNSGWSGQTILKIEEARYPHMYYSRKNKPKSKEDAYRADPYYAMSRNDYLPGYAVTSANRYQMLAKLEQYVRMGEIVLNSERLTEEFKTFIVKITERGERPEAQRGYHDDLIMALAGGLWVREESYMYTYRSDEMARAMLDGMMTSNTPTRSFRDLNHHGSMYDRSRVKEYVAQQNKMVMANGEEIDLSWLCRDDGTIYSG